MTNRETALKNAINRTTSFHDFEIDARDSYRSLLIFNPHSYFKVIIHGYGNNSDGETLKHNNNAFTAVLDILNGDIFTINFKSNIQRYILDQNGKETDEETNSILVNFKTVDLSNINGYEVYNNQQALLVKGISYIETITIEYFDYFELNTNLNDDQNFKPITNEDENGYYGNQIYHLKPIIASKLSIRDGLTAYQLGVKDVVNIRKIKMGPWEFAYNSNDISTTITNIDE